MSFSNYEIIIFILILWNIISSLLHMKERKDLYNRIMASNAREYKIISEKQTEGNRPKNYMREKLKQDGLLKG